MPAPGSQASIRRVAAALAATGTLLLIAPAAQAAPPANDAFASAQPTAPATGFPAAASGTNVEATWESGEPNHAGGYGRHSVWYEWTAGVTAPVYVDTCRANFDTVLAVYTGSSLTSLRIESSADGGCSSGAGSRLSLDATAGRTYRIAVDGRGGATGTFELAVTEVQTTPPTASIADTKIVEGDSGQTDGAFTIRLSRAFHKEVSLEWRTRAVDATPPYDYPESSGTVTFAPGELSKQVPIQVNGDLRKEPDERFSIELFNAINVATILPRVATVTILDDDKPPPPGVTCGVYWCLEPGAGPVQMSTSGDRGELERTIPIRKKPSEQVVMRIDSAELGELGAGSTIETSGELEVSVTCLERMKKCIGKRYRYSPAVAGKLILSTDANGSVGQVVSPVVRIRCSQDLPHRNHHCVLVFPSTRTPLPGGCARCSLNLVLSAFHSNARSGNKLVVGSDAHGGVADDRGRINAIVLAPDAPGPTPDVQPVPSKRIIPVPGRADRGARRRVIYSLRVDDLQQHEQLFVEAESRIRTSGLPYSTFIGSQLILSDSPRGVDEGPLVEKLATLEGEITEKNGFNCTRGPSAHGNPCVVQKFGFVRMRETSRHPLYINLVVELGARFGGRWRGRDEAKVLDAAGIQLWRYGPEGWVEVTIG